MSDVEKKSRNKTNSECSSILLYIFVTRYFKRLHYGKKERKEREKGCLQISD